MVKLGEKFITAGYYKQPVKLLKRALVMKNKQIIAIEKEQKH